MTRPTENETGPANPPSPTRLSRRRLMALLGVAGTGLSASCDDGPATLPTTPSPPATPSTPAAPPAEPGSQCAATPSETRGPFPSITDLVRTDIRDGRDGTELALTITVVEAGNDCAPVPGATVSIWQCDADGDYSQYGAERDESYLRGIQTTDADGQALFTTVYPGWYPGRATHIHVEAFVGGHSVSVSQIAFPDEVSAAVHTVGAYAARGENPTRNATDSLFRDGVSQQTATVTGDPDGSFQATFQLAVTL